MGVLRQLPTLLLGVVGLATMNTLEGALKPAMVACLADGTKPCWLVSSEDFGWLPCPTKQTALNLLCKCDKHVKIFLIYLQTFIGFGSQDFHSSIFDQP